MMSKYFVYSSLAMNERPICLRYDANKKEVFVAGMTRDWPKVMQVAQLFLQPDEDPDESERVRDEIKVSRRRRYISDITTMQLLNGLGQLSDGWHITETNSFGRLSR
jgi:hypothetical protein